jgi:hypothetical protein
VGVAGKRPPETLDVAGINDSLVLGNRIMLGSVNANRDHYEAGHAALARADRAWLRRLITRQVPLEGAADAFTPADDDVKAVVLFDRARGVIA